MVCPHFLYDENKRILEEDDKESLLEWYNFYDEVREVDWITNCIYYEAKKCLIALLTGEVVHPPVPPNGCVTFIHKVVWGFPDPDILDILFTQGAFKDSNVYLHINKFLCGTPLHLLLRRLSGTRVHVDVRRMNLRFWTPGDSIFKLITLLCMPQMKNHLDIARKLASHTNYVNDMAWGFIENGKLLQLTVLLLVAQKKVMSPFKTGMTIQQCLARKFDELSSKVHLDNELALYKSFLMEVDKLFDVFDRAGDDLSTYCTFSVHKYITPEKVLFDVVGVFRKAGIVLQAVDLDLRDCYRDHLGVWKANLFEVSDYPKLNKFPSHLYPTGLSRLSMLGNAHILPNYLRDPLTGKLKLREVLKLADGPPRPRLLSTIAGRGSSITIKHLASIALKMKRGIRF